MTKETTTIRIDNEVKLEFDEIRGEANCSEFLKYLIDFFLGRTK